MAMELNIPLERKDHLGYWIIAGCILFTGASALVSPTFATVFFVSSIVGLPVFIPFFTRKRRGLNNRFIILLGLLAYISIAKSILVPIFLNIILRIIT